jgi:hypothetical protein
MENKIMKIVGQSYPKFAPRMFKRGDKITTKNKRFAGTVLGFKTSPPYHNHEFVIVRIDSAPKPFEDFVGRVYEEYQTGWIRV